ncbi:hypothetical protein D3C80_1718050 [compost metagenome]
MLSERRLIMTTAAHQTEGCAEVAEQAQARRFNEHLRLFTGAAATQQNPAHLRQGEQQQSNVSFGVSGIEKLLAPLLEAPQHISPCTGMTVGYQRLDAQLLK